MPDDCSTVTVAELTTALHALRELTQVYPKWSDPINEALQRWWRSQGLWDRVSAGAIDTLFVTPSTDALSVRICPAEAVGMLATQSGRFASAGRAPAPTDPTERGLPSPNAPPPQTVLEPMQASMLPTMIAAGVLVGGYFLRSSIWRRGRLPRLRSRVARMSRHA